MNEIKFLHTTLTTVVGQFQAKCSFIDIFDSFPISLQLGTLGNEKVAIQAKYYKKDNTIYSEGNVPKVMKALPKTCTFLCTTGVKLRLFFSKAEHFEYKFHVASGLTESNASELILMFYNHLNKRVQCMGIHMRPGLVNGVAQANLGVNLIELVERLKREKKLFLYTPDQSAALKIFLEGCTVCVYSSGKILYMGSKSERILMEIHRQISIEGSSWKGVPIVMKKMK